MYSRHLKSMSQSELNVLYFPQTYFTSSIPHLCHFQLFTPGENLVVTQESSPHHLPQPVRYKILPIPLYGSLQSLPYPHHHCRHSSGTLCLACTAIRATSLVSQSPALLPIPFPHSLHHPQSYFSEMQITPLLRPFRIKANFKWPSVPFHWPLPK